MQVRQHEAQICAFVRGQRGLEEREETLEFKHAG
jgi:hypothetical protein